MLTGLQRRVKCVLDVPQLSWLKFRPHGSHLQYISVSRQTDSSTCLRIKKVSIL